ncbi:hypothetical protein FRAHR75_170097 [Frankia sp. Hr75.2]|nr:hypothetical protein FRAHR75_170097 [Frankia sp. Hr75.2]
MGYYETFNRDNVTLVDLRAGPVQEITSSGIRTGQGSYDVDVILFATGFDALTGALSRIDVRGRGGALLRELWRDEGPVSYLGLQVAGFPNLFMIQGPGSPSAASNFLAAMEHHAEWIADCVAHLRDGGGRTIEALPSAQAEWIDEVLSFVTGSVLVHPDCNSWWNGANVPGKKRMYTTYVGGLPSTGGAVTRSRPAAAPASGTPASSSPRGIRCPSSSSATSGCSTPTRGAATDRCCSSTATRRRSSPPTWPGCSTTWRSNGSSGSGTRWEATWSAPWPSSTRTGSPPSSPSIPPTCSRTRRPARSGRCSTCSSTPTRCRSSSSWWAAWTRRRGCRPCGPGRCAGSPGWPATCCGSRWRRRRPGWPCTRAASRICAGGAARC